MIILFWQLLNYVQHLTGTCTAVTLPAASPLPFRSTLTAQNLVVYGGNCLQAFLVALYSHGSIAWIIGS
jgi:hypothetical protein